MTKTMHYGPQTAEVEALLARARALTDGEMVTLNTAWDAIPGAVWTSAWDAMWVAVRDAARDAAWDAALDAGRFAVQDAAWGAVLDVVQDTALALVVRDQITRDGFTQAHYDLLTGPWRKVIGKVHPGDEEMVAA